MIKKIWYILGFIIIIVLGIKVVQGISHSIKKGKHKKRVETLESSASENVQVLMDTIMIDYLGKKRTLAVYLPKSYSEDSINYPVIYFLDGQSLFDQKVKEGLEWQVDEVLDSFGLISNEQCIVIGVYNSDDRHDEYKPFPVSNGPSNQSISGDQHAAWIVHSLKPWVDSIFRTRTGVESNFIGGASLGGLMSYYMLMQYPKTFGGAIVFSPSFWVHEKVYTLHEKNPNLINQKIYFNAGQREVPTVESIMKMKDILINYGMPEANIRLDIEEGLGHEHRTWNNGFKKTYPWILHPAEL